MAYKRYSEPPAFEGFLYNDVKHEYWHFNKEMTGVTSVLDVAGGAGGLPQYAANHATASALLKPTPVGFKEKLDELVEKYGKLSTDVARELDKHFPEWKESRTAHARNTKKAADRGTDNHALCEDFEKGVPVLHTKATEQYVSWYKDNVEKTYFTERPLFSREWFVGGTPDGGFQLKDGKNLINDKKFKSGMFDNKPHWQMAAYRKMIEEMANDTTTPVKIVWKGSTEEYPSPREYLKSFAEVKWDGSVVLTISEQGVDTAFRYAYEEDRKSFESALWIYRHIKN